MNNCKVLLKDMRLIKITLLLIINFPENIFLIR